MIDQTEDDHTNGPHDLLAEVRAACKLEDPDDLLPRMWTCPARLDATGRFVVCDYPGVSGACAADYHEDEITMDMLNGASE